MNCNTHKKTTKNKKYTTQKLAKELAFLPISKVCIRQYMYIVGKYISFYTHFKNRQKSKSLASFSVLFGSECKLIIYFPTMYVYCLSIIQYQIFHSSSAALIPASSMLCPVLPLFSFICLLLMCKYHFHPEPHTKLLRRKYGMQYRSKYNIILLIRNALLYIYIYIYIYQERIK